MTHCKTISFRCLSQMAKNAMWAEQFYLELGMMDQALRYGRIWTRISEAMLNNIRNHGEY